MWVCVCRVERGGKEIDRNIYLHYKTSICIGELGVQGIVREGALFPRRSALYITSTKLLQSALDHVDGYISFLCLKSGFKHLIFSPGLLNFLNVRH